MVQQAPRIGIGDIPAIEQGRISSCSKFNRHL
jgi:hypothetical protein